MNRLAPLISRAATLRPLPARPQAWTALDMELPAEWRDDVQFFLIAWVGGMIFVGTLFS